MDVKDIRIPASGTHLGASLHRPGGGGTRPLILMAHGFGATRDAGLSRYAERFRREGFLVLVFDYRHFGTSGGEPRQLLSVRRQIEDWHAALNFARALEGVDARRIGLWGTSYSGGHVVRVAAEDRVIAEDRVDGGDRVAAQGYGAGDNPGVAAVVAQVPFASGIRTALKLHALSAAKMTVAGIADLLGAKLLGREPVYVPIVGPPGSMSAMALDEAVEGVERLYGGRAWDNRVPARVALDTLTYRPLRFASGVRCPLLLQVGERDPLTPPGPAAAMARRAPHGRLRSHPVGHFDAYFDPWFDTFIEEQVAFFSEHLRYGG